MKIFNFKKIYSRGKPDLTIFYISVILITVGIISSYSLTTYTTTYFGKHQFYFFVKQLIFGGLSIFIMWFFANINPKYLFVKFKVGLYIFAIFSILMFLVYFIGTEVGGAKRWLKIGTISIAPVEFFKIGFIAYLSNAFYKKMHIHRYISLKEEFRLIAPFLLVFVIFATVVAVLQKDLGQTIIITTILLFMFLFSGRSWKLFFSLVSVVLFILTILIYLFPHRMKRITSWWSSIQDNITPYLPKWLSDIIQLNSQADTYQITNALNTFANGGFFGAGIGYGQFKLGFLAEVHTDFVLAGIAEEVGFFGLSIVILLFIVLIYKIFKISLKSHNQIYALFSFGVGVMIAITITINGFGITGIFPIKGIPVPFLSYGGSATIATALAIGFILSISTEIKTNNFKK